MAAISLTGRPILATGSTLQAGSASFQLMVGGT